MSKQQQTSAKQPSPSVSGAVPLHNRWFRAPELYVAKSVKACFQTLLFIGITASLASCFDDNSGSQIAEQPSSQAATDGETEATPPTEETTTNAASDEPPRTGSRYRVTAETSYFFDAPEQGKPSGKYLLRGDVIYGEQESNGFVKTRFKNPSGATVTGWLKVQELSRLAANPTPGTARSSRPSPAASPPATASEPVAAYEVEKPESETVEPAGASANESATAVVQVARSYFYNSPDLTQPRKAHCVKGDKVRLGESRGEAVFVTFTNWEKVTTTGWMRKDALR